MPHITLSECIIIPANGPKAMKECAKRAGMSNLAVPQYGTKDRKKDRPRPVCYGKRGMKSGKSGNSVWSGQRTVGSGQIRLES